MLFLLHISSCKKAPRLKLEVTVTEVRDRATTVVELAVAAPDMGRIIGKRGRVIDSIRALMQVRAAKEGRRVELELLEADKMR